MAKITPKIAKVSRSSYFSPWLLLDEKTLYVVANRRDAVFYIDGRGKKFEFDRRLIHESGTLMEQELDSDRPGRGISNAGDGTIRHGLDRRFNRHESEARSFARRIAEELKNAFHMKRFQSLVLVAGPHFLGLLRDELDPRVRKAVIHEIPHEYAEGGDTKVRSQIFRAIGTEGL